MKFRFFKNNRLFFQTSFFFLFYLSFSNSIYAVPSCALAGGSCDNPCGFYYLCQGGTYDGKVYNTDSCVGGDYIANGCYMQNDLPCFCGGCANVDIVGGSLSSCQTEDDGCGGVCNSVSELSVDWAKYIMMGVFTGFAILLGYRKTQKLLR